MISAMTLEAALCIGDGFGGGALPFLRSQVRSHGPRLLTPVHNRQVGILGEAAN